MTVYVLYMFADPAEDDMYIMGVYSTKEKAEIKQEQIKKRLKEVGNRRTVYIRIDECELDV